MVEPNNFFSAHQLFILRGNLPSFIWKLTKSVSRQLLWHTNSFIIENDFILQMIIKHITECEKR